MSDTEKWMKKYKIIKMKKEIKLHTNYLKIEVFTLNRVGKSACTRPLRPSVASGGRLLPLGPCWVSGELTLTLTLTLTRVPLLNYSRATLRQLWHLPDTQGLRAFVVCGFVSEAM